MKRKTLLLFFILLLAFLWLPKKVVLAQESAGGNNPLLEYKESISGDGPDLNQWIGGKETKEGKRANGVIDSVVLKGISLTAGLPDENGNFTGGLIGISGVAMASLFDTPPASGVTYFADLFHNLGIAKPAYAQGVGFSGLSPVLTIWKAFRNFAYLLITILFVILGLMIMFRVKLSPQAVISVQSAIPKVVIALILITFSYAIAGLLIDLGNLILILVIKVLETNKLIDPQTTSEWLSAGISKTITTTLGNLISGTATLLFSNWTTGGTIGVVGIAGVIVGLVTQGAIIAPLVPVLLALFFGLALAILGLVFKIVVMLIKAYVSIIIGVILGPLQIIFDVLPGQKTSAFNSWSKSLLANILVFPVVAILFILSSVFDKALGAGQTLWTPPTLSSNNLMVAAFIKLGILMIIPNVDKVIMQALDVKTSLGSALGRDPLLEKPGRFFREGRTAGIQKLTQTGSSVTDPKIKEAIDRITEFSKAAGWVR